MRWRQAKKTARLAGRKYPRARHLSALARIAERQWIKMGARDPNRRRDEREFIVGTDPSTGEPLGLLCPKVPDAELPSVADLERRDLAAAEQLAKGTPGLRMFRNIVQLLAMLAATTAGDPDS